MGSLGTTACSHRFKNMIIKAKVTDHQWTRKMRRSLDGALGKFVLKIRCSKMPIV